MDEYTLRVMMKERVADRQREAARARLRQKASRPGFRALALEILGDVLIRLGRMIKSRYGLGPETAGPSRCRSKRASTA